MRRSNPAWRDLAATELAVRALEGSPPVGRALVLGDPRSELAEAVRAGGGEAVGWSRRRSGDRPASAWPPAGSFELVALRLPKAKDELEMLARVAASRMTDDGRLWVYGANDEGAGSVASRLDSLFGAIRTVASGGRCRVVELRDPVPAVRTEMSDWRGEHDLEDPRLPRPWVSYPGCFAHGRLDSGTRLLLDHLPSFEAGARVLDFGCGTGVIAAAVRDAQPDARLTLLDSDALALEAARENVPGAELVLSDGLVGLREGSEFDWILGNPPYHEGKAGSRSVIEAFAEGASRVLARGGRILLVVQRTFALDRSLDRYFEKVSLRAEDRSYRVWEASV